MGWARGERMAMSPTKINVWHMGNLSLVTYIMAGNAVILRKPEKKAVHVYDVEGEEEDGGY